MPLAATAEPYLAEAVPAADGRRGGVLLVHGYSRTPLRAAHSMLRGWQALRDRLPEVTATMLVFRSAVDHVVDPSSGALIEARVSSRDLTERVLENSYHVATLDNDAPVVFEESSQFVRRVTGP